MAPARMGLTDVTSWSRTEAGLEGTLPRSLPPVTAENSRAARVTRGAGSGQTRGRDSGPSLCRARGSFSAAPALQETGRHPWSLRTARQEHLLSRGRENHECLQKSPNVPWGPGSAPLRTTGLRPWPRNTAFLIDQTVLLARCPRSCFLSHLFIHSASASDQPGHLEKTSLGPSHPAAPSRLPLPTPKP